MKINWRIFWIAVFFWYEESSYYGWNLHPYCLAELACDGFALFLLALAYFQTTVNVHVHTEN